MNNRDNENKAPQRRMSRSNRGNFEKPKNLSLTVKKLFSYLKSFMPFIIVALIFAGASSVFSIIGPNKLSDLTDELSNGLVLDKNKIEVISKDISSTLNEENIKEITKRSNKSYIKILLDIYICYLKYSITYEEYKIFGFENVSKNKRDTYVGKIRKEYINKHLTDKHALSLLNNKTKFNIKFDKYLNREIINIKDISYKEYEDFVKDKKEITCRCEAPDEGRTIKFNLKDYRSPAFILEKINKNKLYYMEATHKPNKLLEKLNKNNLTTISIVTVHRKNTIDILYAEINMYLKDKTLSSKIDLKSKKTIYDFIDEKYNVYKTHPETNENLNDIELPLIDEMINISKTCALAIDEIKEIKWNFTLSNTKAYLVSASLWNDYIEAQIPNYLKDSISFMPYYRKVINEKRKIK